MRKERGKRLIKNAPSSSLLYLYAFNAVFYRPTFLDVIPSYFSSSPRREKGAAAEAKDKNPREFCYSGISSTRGWLYCIRLPSRLEAAEDGE